MQALYTYLNMLLNQGKSEFSQWPELNWLNPYLAQGYNEQRDEYLKKLDALPLFKETKPSHNHISKGCQICGEGKWSCLFITNECNAACFYCPTAQNLDERPSTQGLDFKSPEAYADYVNYLGFKGVSFSGGEPFLHFERTLRYLEAVRRKCDPEIYTWCYTNGILADKEKIQALADAGLDELRFDIGATGFSLDYVRKAKGIIPNITIEIPAVPEEMDRLKKLIPEMIEAGVSNLNLHQMRLTPYNAGNLLSHNYTIIPAEKPIVLESELGALELLNAVEDMGLDIGVNYCSFFFKSRFQKKGYRRMLIDLLAPEATVTENSYIREYEDDVLSYSTLKLAEESQEIAAPLANKTQLKGISFTRNLMFKEHIPEVLRVQVDALINEEPLLIPADPMLFRIWQKEYIERGLRDY